MLPRPDDTVAPRWAVASMLALAVLLAATPGRPCGPWFPNSILATGAEVEATPVTVFELEVGRLVSAPVPLVEARRWGAGAAAVADAEREELAAALAASGANPDSLALASYHATREAIRSYQEAFDEWRRDRRWSAPGTAGPARPELGRVEIPSRDGLPAEFLLYLEGAVAYHQGRAEAAREAWQTLLALPEAERQHRSTWAAFMLGRLALGDGDGALHPATAEEAASHFRATRELAARGFVDRLGLAHGSLGWEGRAAWRSGRFAEAIALYFEQLEAGDSRAYASLHQVCGRLAAAGPGSYPAVAAMPLPREIFTLYLLGHPGKGDPAAWEAALRAAGAEAAATGPMAWSAYQAGRFDDAGRWAELAPAGDLHALWVRAKLLLRAGEPAAAVPLLDEVSSRFPDFGWGGEGEEHPLASGVRAAGEAGAVVLALGRREEALDRFLRAGYWIDAAYVAERVLTVDELAAYVDRTWPRELQLPERPWYVGSRRRPDEASIAWRLRYLLARRLAREGRWRDAIPYFPKPRLPRDAAEVAAWLECGDDPACSPERRAEALWRAAERLRWKGLALVASELDPDWQVWGAQFDTGTYGLDPAARAGHGFFGASPDEAARYVRSRPEPYRRFHYRYVAADLAWRAAERMPDGDERTARVLATAGTWLMVRDPQAADRFYKALVRRCGATALGREAERRRWFPPL